MFYTLQADRETYRQTWPCVLGAQRRFLQLQNTHYSNPNLNHLEILFSYCCCYGCDGSHDPTTHPAADTGTARQTDRHPSARRIQSICVRRVHFGSFIFCGCFFYDPATPETPCSSRPICSPSVLPLCPLSTNNIVRNIVARSFSLIIQIIFC